MENTTCSIAGELSLMLTKVEEKADAVAGNVANKLHPIMVDDLREEDGAEAKEMEWPPLFTELRAKVRQIDASLDAIQRNIDRTAL